MSKKSKKILIVRNDKLGDFILALPAIALLKKNCPACHITVLVPAYTQAVAKMNPDIDAILIDPGAKAPWQQQWQLWRELRRARFDAVISLFSTTRIGFLLRFCGISYRLAPATKVAQIFYNRRLRQRRSRSLKPEYQYNADLVAFYLKQQHGLQQLDATQAPYLPFTRDDRACAQLLGDNFGPDNKRIVIHPGSGGSANNLSLDQYARLADILLQHEHIEIIISAGPGEEDVAKSLKNKINHPRVSLFISDRGLAVFVQFLTCIDLFIAGSTGTLHLAAALNIATLGFYPRRRSATALRWQTINDEDKRLAISVAADSSEEDMSAIDLQDCARQLIAKMPQCLGLPG